MKSLILSILLGLSFGNVVMVSQPAQAQVAQKVWTLPKAYTVTVGNHTVTLDKGQKVYVKAVNGNQVTIQATHPDIAGQFVVTITK